MSTSNILAADPFPSCHSLHLRSSDFEGSCEPGHGKHKTEPFARCPCTKPRVLCSRGPTGWEEKATARLSFWRGYRAWGSEVCPHLLCRFQHACDRRNAAQLRAMHLEVESQLDEVNEELRAERAQKEALKIAKQQLQSQLKHMVKAEKDLTKGCRLLLCRLGPRTGCKRGREHDRDEHREPPQMPQLRCYASLPRSALIRSFLVGTQERSDPFRVAGSPGLRIQELLLLGCFTGRSQLRSRPFACGCERQDCERLTNR